MSANAYAAGQQRLPIMHKNRLVSQAGSKDMPLKIPTGPSPLGQMSASGMSSALGQQSVNSTLAARQPGAPGAGTELSSYQ